MTQIMPPAQKIEILAGLPFRTALFYMLLFFASFWIYTALWQTAPIMASDSGGYLKLASDLSHFRFDQLYYRTPGYPIFLIITGSSEFPNRLLFFVSLLLHFTSIFILGSILHRCGLTEIMLILFAVLLLLPPYVESAAYVLTENLAEFMLVINFTGLAFWFAHQKTIWLLVSALAIGYAGLTRPIYQGLSFALAGFFFVISLLYGWDPLKLRDVTRATLILICISGILIGGYAFINYQKFGYFGITPLTGFVLTSKTSRVIERLPDEYSQIRESLIRARDIALVDRGGPHTGYEYVSNQGVIQELLKITGLQLDQLSSYMLRINLVLIREAPQEYIVEVFRALSSYWIPASTALANMNSRFVQLIWFIIHFCLIGIFFLTMLAVSSGTIYIITCKRFLSLSNDIFIGGTTFWKAQVFFYFLATTIVLYNALFTCMIEIGNPRYRVPTDGFIAFMAFLGVALWKRAIRFMQVVFEERFDSSKIN